MAFGFRLLSRRNSPIVAGEYIMCHDSRSHLGRVLKAMNGCDAGICWRSRGACVDAWSASPCAAVVTWTWIRDFQLMEMYYNGDPVWDSGP